MTAILGISAFYHDSAAALVVDGEIVAAAQEERFSRKKHDHAFPARAISYCLREGGLSHRDVEYVVFYEKPVRKFERLLETHLAYAPFGSHRFRMAIPVWLKEKLYIPRTIRRELNSFTDTRIVFTDHHESHAASAFFPSPFEEAAILTLDGVGEWSTTTLGMGKGNRIELTQHLQFPHSLGLLYSAFTYYCGFTVNSGEYKLMGLAPYGKPIYQEAILKHLVDLKPDGSFWLNMGFFDYCQGLTMTNRRFDELFGGAPRKPDSAIEPRHMDLAASIQKVTEEVFLRLGRTVYDQTGLKRLVLAGGVALNCVANGRLLREGPFDDIWVQPASGDAGGALGAALFVWHQLLGNSRTVRDGHDSQDASLLGPRFSANSIGEFLDKNRAVYDHFADEAELLECTARQLAEGKVVGWFQGRMEFGPRALGGRSILGDPRSSCMQAKVNLKIKFRESFRPFAPCVLREHVHEWFAMRPGEDSPYMLFVAPLLEQHRAPLSPEDQEIIKDEPDLVRRVNVVRSSVPAITHVDFSARVQTVDQRHERFYRLLREFRAQTGCPMLVNTSFNLSWEPIVCTPEEAYRTFMQSEMDVLVLEDYVLHKANQPRGWGKNGAVDRYQIASSDSTTSHDALCEIPWADPVSGELLVWAGHSARNPTTGQRYPVKEGIGRFFVPTQGPPDSQKVLEIVKQFYEQTPFPNYDDCDDRRTFFQKARKRQFAKLLNEQIPYDARVLEIGCGTGQLTNFLAMANRSVLGIDACLNSLRLAHNFKSDQGLTGATFAQMNLFRPALRDGFFDYVISNGVLHHTSDCRAAFLRISRLARPGGYVVVGLYNAYSRWFHYARRSFARCTGWLPCWLDPYLVEVSAEGKREAWYRDQYRHPHETCHTIDELLEWLDEAGLDFVNSIPKPEGGMKLSSDEELFAPRSVGTQLSRLRSQLADLHSGWREGGFFIVIGRKRRGEIHDRSRIARTTRAATH